MSLVLHQKNICMKTDFDLWVGNNAKDAKVNILCAIQKGCGLILIGHVKKGMILKGATVKIGSTIFTDEIVQIEIDHEPVHIAKEGCSVGICLKTTNRDTLAKLLHKQLVFKKASPSQTTHNDTGARLERKKLYLQKTSLR